MSSVMVSPAVAAPMDQVTGSGKVDFGETTAHLTISATGTATKARGHVKFDYPTPYTDDFKDLKAEVTCVRVQGNMASVTARIIDPDPDTFIEYIEVTVQDNGTPGKRKASDLVYVALSSDSNNCWQDTPWAPLKSGNFTVKDR